MGRTVSRGVYRGARDVEAIEQEVGRELRRLKHVVLPGRE